MVKISNHVRDLPITPYRVTLTLIIAFCCFASLPARMNGNYRNVSRF